VYKDHLAALRQAADFGPYALTFSQGHHWLVHLTGHEVTLIPGLAASAVAIVAIGFSYFQNKATNRNSLQATKESNANALAIAREERASKREDELNALKRTVYGQCIGAFNVVAKEFAGMAGKVGPSRDPAGAAEAAVAAENAIAELSLIAPEQVISGARAVRSVLDVDLEQEGWHEVFLRNYPSVLTALEEAMRKDLAEKADAAIVLD
jgi:hypothetical protein